MKKIRIAPLMIGLLFGTFSSGFSQKIISSDNSFIVAITAIYSSNLMNTNSIDYENLYLIVNDRPINIDSMMCKLSKKNYSKMSAILDTLNQYCKVYSIARDEEVFKSKTDTITKCLTDCNRYQTAYLFSLNDEVRRNGPITAYVLQRYSRFQAIGYSILNKKCDVFPYECTAVIKKLE